MPTAPLTIAQLMKMTQGELDALFRSSAVGDIPEGEARGTAIVRPGGLLTRLIAWKVRRLAWQGKVFERNPDGQAATLRNKVSAFGAEAIVAKVYKAPSWLDGKECIVLDYSQTSLLARKVRDEIREVAPRVYLGKVYWGKKRLIDFALELPA